MKLILHHSYSQSSGMSALDTLRALTHCGAHALVCRIRRSSDNVLLVHQDTTMARLCLCEERIDALRFCEIDALMRLSGYSILTLNELLENYTEKTPLILHFRGFRPDASVISRFIGDPRFSFATDSVEQLRVIAGGFPAHRTVGFACHIPNAAAMLRAGASAVCLYGRRLSEYPPEQLLQLGAGGRLLLEIPELSAEGLDAEMQKAGELACYGVLLAPESIR